MNVLITGASRGIGRGIALRFAEPGTTICVNHFDDADAAAQTVAEVERLGARAVAYAADVSKSDQVDGMVDAILSEHGSIDVLVANAGICPFAEMFELGEQTWDRVLDVNLKGVFLSGRRVARSMLERGVPGSIVLISSVAAWVPGVQQPHYAASKAGVLSLARSLVLALSGSGIRVNSVLPGNILTDIYKPALTDEQVAAMSRDIPLGRAGLPADIASAVHFLASAEASYITGAELTVDGGALVGRTTTGSHP